MAKIQKVAVVTGANKGLGYCTTRQLCRRFDGVVLLTARDERRGQIAVEQLEAEGLSPIFHDLDVTDVHSIQRLKLFIQNQFGRVDVLVQNAGIAFEEEAESPSIEHVQTTIDTNFKGVLNVFRTLHPLLQRGARVVNVTSGMGKLEILAPRLRVKFADPYLTESQLVDLIEQYVEEAKEDRLHQNGWPRSPYGISKLAVIALTKVQARQMERMGMKDVLVSSISPGWVKTDMGGDGAPYTADQGARCIVEMAFLPNCNPNGQFWRRGKLASW